jgi:hypothetical protein
VLGKELETHVFVEELILGHQTNTRKVFDDFGNGSKNGTLYNINKML